MSQDVSLPTPARDGRGDRAGYLTALLESAPADVRGRLAEIGEFTLVEENLAMMRGRRLRDPGTPSVAVEHSDHLAPGGPGGPDVPVRLHREAGITEPRPALVSIHGGGYVVGTHLADDDRFDQWSPALRCVGISVGYRLAPETPYPGPLEDCYAVLRWAYRNASELRIDPGRIGIIGGSAGGGLAAGLALLARDRGEVPVAFQALSYPMLDNRPTRSGLAGAPVWGPSANQFGWSSYLSGLTPGQDIPGYAVPARATDLAGMPPAFVAVSISTACWMRTPTMRGG